MQKGPDGEDHIRVGKLNLVDLAGSERQAKTGSTVRHYLHCVLCVYSCSTILPTSSPPSCPPPPCPLPALLPTPSPPGCRARGSRRQQESTSPSLLSAMSFQLWYSGWGLVQWVGPGTVGGAWYSGWGLVQWVEPGTVGGDWYSGWGLVQWVEPGTVGGAGGVEEGSL